MARHSTHTEVDASQIVFRTGGLTETEIAAVTAVLTATLREQAAHDEPSADAATTAWQRDQRNLRAPLLRGDGAWNAWR
ncbi:acyl-CoA carboxylase subunit epsilon [Rathayibacter sp. CAU 1779]